MYYPAIRLSLVNDLHVYVGKDTHVRSITIVEINVEVHANLNIGKI